LENNIRTTDPVGTDISDIIYIDVLADGKFLDVKSLTSDENPLIPVTAVAPDGVYNYYIHTDGSYET
jgi:hypothetical protein